MHIRWSTSLDKIVNGDLALIIDCGEADFFLEVNKDLHNRLLARKIDHDFYHPSRWTYRNVLEQLHRLSRPFLRQVL